MRLFELKEILTNLHEINFQLPDGSVIPKHFHVTEIGQIHKTFIDCGGTVRKETSVNFQLWEAGDFDHRLAPQKLNDIISLSEKKMDIQDAEIEVEYQGDTIGKYGLAFEGKNFLLTAKQTTCLASDKCGIPSDITYKTINSAECCNAQTGCC